MKQNVTLMINVCKEYVYVFRKSRDNVYGIYQYIVRSIKGLFVGM